MGTSERGEVAQSSPTINVLLGFLLPRTLQNFIHLQ
jgi:hypothetical protein